MTPGGGGSVRSDGEGGPGEYTVHEVNHTVEFKALDAATDVDVPARVVDWLEAKAVELADDGADGAEVNA